LKAFVLAAGAGTRLRPLTDTAPKPMVPIAGRPILEHNLRRLAEQGVSEVVMNLHHLPDVIREHFGDGSRLGLSIRYSYEPELLGTAGALRPWKHVFTEPFLLLYGDNLNGCDFRQLAAFHRARGAFATVALFWREDTSQSGIAETDDEGRVRRFLEKPPPDQAFSKWVNAGALFLEPAAVDLIPPAGAPDFSRELLPKWIAEGRAVYGYRMSAAEPLWWIDTPADLLRVQHELEAHRPS
jgi:NDP-sugar pyrophosphorylase family protein